MENHLVDMHVSKSGAQKGIIRCKSAVKRRCHRNKAKDSLSLFAASGKVQGETEKLGPGRTRSRARSRAHVKTRPRCMARGRRVRRGRHPVPGVVGPGGPR